MGFYNWKILNYCGYCSLWKTMACDFWMVWDNLKVSSAYGKKYVLKLLKIQLCKPKILENCNEDVLCKLQIDIM